MRDSLQRRTWRAKTKHEEHEELKRYPLRRKTRNEENQVKEYGKLIAWSDLLEGSIYTNPGSQISG